MSDAKTDSTKTTQAVPATKPGNPAGRLRPKSSRGGWKRWKFKTSVLLMLLGVCAIIVYLLRAGLAKQYEGVGAALSVIACFLFLVWHLVHLFAEQDAIEEKEYPEEFPGLKSANKESNQGAPPPGSGG